MNSWMLSALGGLAIGAATVMGCAPRAASPVDAAAPVDVIELRDQPDAADATNARQFRLNKCSQK